MAITKTLFSNKGEAVLRLWTRCGRNGTYHTGDISTSEVGVATKVANANRVHFCARSQQLALPARMDGFRSRAFRWWEQ